MAGHCQWLHGAFRSDERKKIGAVNSFVCQKEGSELQFKNQVRVVIRRMCVFSLYFVKYMIFLP